jgi:hypothetical protein
MELHFGLRGSRSRLWVILLERRAVFLVNPSRNRLLQRGSQAVRLTSLASALPSSFFRR